MLTYWLIAECWLHLDMIIDSLTLFASNPFIICWQWLYSFLQFILGLLCNKSPNLGNSSINLRNNYHADPCIISEIPLWSKMVNLTEYYYGRAINNVYTSFPRLRQLFGLLADDCFLSIRFGGTNLCVIQL